MYIINMETDGDGWYHVHKSNCNKRPMTNFKPLHATNVNAAIEEAKRLLNKPNVARCSHCCS